MNTPKRFAPAVGLILIAGAIFISVSLFSYHPGDAGHAAAPGPVYNYGGQVGAWLSLFLLLILGYGAWALPAALSAEGCFLIFSSRSRPVFLSLLYEIFVFASFSALWSLRRGLPPRALGWQLERVGWGGYWGREASGFLLAYLGLVGTRIILVTVFVLSILLLTDMKPLFWGFLLARRTLGFVRALLPSGRVVKVGRTPARSAPPPAAKRDAEEERIKERAALEKKQEELKRRVRELEELKARERKEADDRRREEEVRERARQEKERRAQGMEKEQERRKQEKRREAEAARRKRPATAPAAPAAKVITAAGGGAYRLPSLDLLITPPPLTEREIKDDIEVNSKILESTLQDFGIEAKVVGAERGPAITRYELQPAPGVKVSKIKTLDNDIALAMKAVSIRILAPIPGKAAIGIEVPNSSTSLVYVREMLESPEFQNGHARLPLALGKDISGTPIVADLTDMPHLLIAGATGSGKTVCMNSVIVSLLFARTPDELQMILVDPKKVEMAAYARLPHLICPVVTDTVKTSLALAWLVKEMERRYDLFARVGARNIEGYNRAPKALPTGEGEEELPATIPYILLMIDEMADLMLQAQTEIENQIARLAHLSRAVGIHMILATQRPSVDVITGVIKANFPARLSFKVAAKVDSRTVLDTSGADKLLGNGDLLFLPPATSRLIRAQGTLCQDSEIEAVVGFVNRQREPRFRAEIFQRAVNAAGIALGGGEDILLEAAIEVIKQTGRASVSVLQRKLKIGYSRSSRIVDILEEKGIVGPYQGSKERDVLIDTYAGSAPADEEKEEK